MPAKSRSARSDTRLVRPELDGQTQVLVVGRLDDEQVGARLEPVEREGQLADTILRVELERIAGRPERQARVARSCEPDLALLAIRDDAQKQARGGQLPLEDLQDRGERQIEARARAPDPGLRRCGLGGDASDEFHADRGAGLDHVQVELVLQETFTEALDPQQGVGRLVSNRVESGARSVPRDVHDQVARREPALAAGEPGVTASTSRTSLPGAMAVGAGSKPDAPSPAGALGRSGTGTSRVSPPGTSMSSGS